jgi:predicted lipoprotein with Yx(FWY)xxD motif
LGEGGAALGGAAQECGFHTEAPLGGTGGSPGEAGAGGDANEYDLTLQRHAGLGEVLTDASGHTLYVFGADVPGDCAHLPQSSCSGSCAQSWPVFYGSSRALAPQLDDEDFGDFVAASGVQTAFYGWPLYSNFGEPVGSVLGEGAGKGMWHVAREPFYNVMIMKKKLEDQSSVTYLADGEGFALYASSGDVSSEAKPVSNCDAACAVDWPPFSLDRFVLPSSFADDDFSVFVRPDGVLQAAYRGTPLYRFDQDSKPGDTNGNAQSTFALVSPVL